MPAFNLNECEDTLCSFLLNVQSKGPQSVAYIVKKVNIDGCELEMEFNQAPYRGSSPLTQLKL